MSISGTKIDSSLIGIVKAPSCYKDVVSDLKDEEGWNSHVPNQIGTYDKKLTLDRLKEMMPEDVARALFASITAFKQMPTPHSFPDGCIGSVSYVVHEKIYTFRALLCDPLDERGCFYYRGQGYAPHIAFVVYHSGKWYSTKI